MSVEPRTITPDELTPVELAPGVALRAFVSEGATGSKALTVCSATFSPGAELPCHTHPTSEVIYAFSGYAEAVVEERAYILRPGDLLHVPAGVSHLVRNSGGEIACLYTFFPTPAPGRDLVPPPGSTQFLLVSPPNAPERIIRSGDSWKPSAEWPVQFAKAASNGFVASAGTEGAALDPSGIVTYLPGAPDIETIRPETFGQSS